jgi:VanZ family protein
MGLAVVRREFAMMSRRSIALAVAALAILYGVLLLYPFEWQPPRFVENRAERTQEAVVFRGPGLAYTEAAPEWLDEAIRSDRISISLLVRSLQEPQHGPARIMTISEDTDARNVTLAQDGADLIIRVRRPGASPNGIPAFTLAGALTPNSWRHIEFTIRPGHITAALDGKRMVDEAIPPHALWSWDSRFRLALGNEFTGNRPWIGEIRQARVTVAGSAVDYAQPGRLVFPPEYLVLHGRWPNFVPGRRANLTDAVQNTVLFVPLGVLLTLWAGVGARGIVTTVMAAAGLSIGLELLQLGIVDRHSSATDVLFNTAGALAGYLLVVLARWRGWVRRERRLSRDAPRRADG